MREITINPGVSVSSGLSRGNSQVGLEKACADFESIFLTHMLKSMKTAFAEDNLLGNSNESQIIRSLFEENLALGLAKGGGMGLGKILFESLKDQI